MIEMTCPVCDHDQDVELAEWCRNDGDLVEHTCERCGIDFEGYLTISWEVLSTRLS
jgi:hypothetical protein